MDDSTSTSSECPICGKSFAVDNIEVHVNRCIFLNCTEEKQDENKNKKRNFGVFNREDATGETTSKKSRTGLGRQIHGLASKLASASTSSNPSKTVEPNENPTTTSKPLADRVRPESIDDYVGQDHITGQNTILRNILEKNEVPSMILWGPPGVGKTTLAHIIANRCKQTQSTRFVKLSATMAGVNDIKQAAIVARNEQKFKRKTILFLDEIHRFNKLQQVS